jgi:dolichol-phosphate mannosyltransferase
MIKYYALSNDSDVQQAMNSTAPLISIVSPVYGAATLLPELVTRIHNTVSQITSNYEIILVEDNSPDNSWEVIKKMSETDDKIIGLSLSRNFGQQKALNAGFDHAQGEWIVSLDCDLQDEPEHIADLYHEAQKGYHIVFACRVDRQHGYVERLSSRLFYKTLGYLTETSLDSSIGNFVLYSRMVIDAMSKIGDYYKYYPLLNNWAGFKASKLPVKHAERKDGKKSSYTFQKRFHLAFTTIIAYSDKPLRLVVKFGIALVSIIFLVALFLIYRYLATGKEVSGWLSVFLSIWLLSGITIIILGLIGTYIGKMFETVKNRPRYLIKETTKKT